MRGMHASPRFTSKQFITRLDYARTRGWWVRLYKAGQLVASKLFSDGKHGGRRAALQAAQKWRDAQFSKHAIPWPIRQRTVAAHSTSIRNVQQIPGVALQHRKRGANTYSIQWLAVASVRGKQLRKTWSVRKYGYEEAYALAAAFRLRETGQPRPTCPPAPRWLILLARQQGFLHTLKLPVKARHA